MLCCFDTTGAPDKAYNRQSSDVVVSSYPGQRRFVRTGGNALSAIPPSSSPENGDQMVSVTIPPGVQAGQSLQVQSPDGRIVQAFVPSGLTQGEQFLVQMPPHGNNSSAASLPPVIPPQDYSMLRPLPPPRDDFVIPSPAPKSSGAAAISHDPIAPIMTDAVATPVYEDSHTFNPIHQPQPTGNRQQKIMKVQVPPNVPAGSTIHVQVPGENRTIAAQVPHGVSEFHVAYDPIGRGIPPQPPSSGQKLLLVNVPQGTLPGATIHVAVPNEPGRVISATVPPNVSQFHVSYVPRGMQHHGAVGPMNSPSIRESSQNHGNSMDHGNYSHNNYNSNQAGMAGYILPVLGGAALGAAGMSIFDHYGHQ